MKYGIAVKGLFSGFAYMAGASEYGKDNTIAALVLFLLGFYLLGSAVNKEIDLTKLER